MAGVSKAMPEWRRSSLYHWKNCWQKARLSWMQPKRSGKSGRYFMVRIGAAVALGDTQVGHKEVDFMTGPSVGMNGELAGRDLVLADGFLNKCLASSAPSSTRSSSR
jgi:hypothetical protein